MSRSSQFPGTDLFLLSLGFPSLNTHNTLQAHASVCTQHQSGPAVRGDRGIFPQRGGVCRVRSAALCDTETTKRAHACTRAHTHAHACTWTRDPGLELHRLHWTRCQRRVSDWPDSAAQQACGSQALGRPWKGEGCPPPHSTGLLDCVLGNTLCH